MTGAELIAAERARQVSEEGWTAGHDIDEHGDGGLLSAGISYALYAFQRHPLCGWTFAQVDGIVLEDWWPWDERDLKPGPDSIRDLTKAGALIAAEIDRVLAVSGNEEETGS